MNVRNYESRDHDRLDAFLLKTRCSSQYHRVKWKFIIEESFGHKVDYLIAEENDVILGVLPLVHINSFLFGNYMVSMPYFNYGGPCAANEHAREMLVQEAIRFAGDRKVKSIEFRSTESWGNGFPVKTGKVCMVLPLRRSPEDMWKGFSAKLRAQVRRPGHEGMTARIGREEELDGFYKVFSINMRDLGTPVYPKRFFENVLRFLPENTWICTVYKGPEPVASGLLSGFKDRLEIPWASSIREYNRLSPNMLLYWTSIGFACDSGYDFFDFGRSTPGEGTYRFKEQWGAKPVQLYWHYWLSEGSSLPELNTKNPRYEMAIRIWKKMPVTLTRIVGPLIVKNLP